MSGKEKIIVHSEIIDVMNKEHKFITSERTIWENISMDSFS